MLRVRKESGATQRRKRRRAEERQAKESRRRGRGMHNEGGKGAGAYHIYLYNLRHADRHRGLPYSAESGCYIVIYFYN